jgi:hypothetical protein
LKIVSPTVTGIGQGAKLQGRRAGRLILVGLVAEEGLDHENRESIVLYSSPTAGDLNAVNPNNDSNSGISA